MSTFQRARSEEQREARRRAILDTAAAMLAEMPVAEVTLNELSRRVGLAKSNVLRYFESREAVLLELLDAAWQDWLAELEERLASPSGTGANDREVADGRAPARYVTDGRAANRRAVRDGEPASTDAPVTAARADQLADILAASLTDRPVLCDLLSAQTAVLERNVSPVVAATYKRAAIANVGALARLALGRVPELGEQDAMKFAGAAVMVTGALWASTQPSAAMLVAYDSDPALADMRLDFASTLREVLEVLIAGLLARSST